MFAFNCKKTIDSFENCKIIDVTLIRICIPARAWNLTANQQTMPNHTEVLSGHLLGWLDNYASREDINFEQHSGYPL